MTPVPVVRGELASLVLRSASSHTLRIAGSFAIVRSTLPVISRRNCSFWYRKHRIVERRGGMGYRVLKPGFPFSFYSRPYTRRSWWFQGWGRRGSSEEHSMGTADSLRRMMESFGSLHPVEVARQWTEEMKYRDWDIRQDLKKEYRQRGGDLWPKIMVQAEAMVGRAAQVPLDIGARRDLAPILEPYLKKFSRPEGWTSATLPELQILLKDLELFRRKTEQLALAQTVRPDLEGFLGGKTPRVIIESYQNNRWPADKRRSLMEEVRQRLDEDPHDSQYGWSGRLRTSYPRKGGVSTKETWSSVNEESNSETNSAFKRKVPISVEDISNTNPKPQRQHSSSQSSFTSDNISTMHQPAPAVDTQASAPFRLSSSGQEIRKPGVGSRLPAKPEFPLPSPSKSSMFTPAEPRAHSEYDPITNRMVQRSDEAFSHYGQELDTENDIPFRSQRAQESSASEGLTSPESKVADVLAELQEYKARRLPDSLGSILSSEQTNTEFKSRNSETATTGEEPQRSKLEQSYSKIQAAAQFTDASISKPGKPTLEKNISLRTNVEAANRVLVDTTEQRFTVPFIDRPREFIKHKDGAWSPVVDEAKADQTPAAKFRTRLAHEEQTSRLEPAIERLGSKPLGTSVEGSREIGGSGVFPLLFGDKPVRAVKSSQRETPDSAILKTEVNSQKAAMEAAEERSASKDNTASAIPVELSIPADILAKTAQPQSSGMEDAELVQVLQDIYEKEHGPIIPQEPKLSPPTSRPATPSSSEPVWMKYKRNSKMAKHEKENIRNPQVTRETAVYTVLAYDPATSEVSTTTLSAPVSTRDEVLPLTVALTKLDQPAKFLPHLRLLRDQGFYAISSTKNLLVLRGVTAPVLQSDTSSNATADVTSGISKPDFPKSPPPMPSSQGVRSKPERSPFVKSLQPNFSQRRVEEMERGRPQRQERIYTGSRSSTGGSKDNHPLSGFWYGFGAFGAIASGVLYFTGLSSGMKRVVLPATPVPDIGSQRK